MFISGVADERLQHTSLFLDILAPMQAQGPPNPTDTGTSASTEADGTVLRAGTITTTTMADAVLQGGAEAKAAVAGWLASLAERNDGRDYSCTTRRRRRSLGQPSKDTAPKGATPALSEASRLSRNSDKTAPTANSQTAPLSKKRFGRQSPAGALSPKPAKRPRIKGPKEDALSTRASQTSSDCTAETASPSPTVPSPTAGLACPAPEALSSYPWATSADFLPSFLPQMPIVPPNAPWVPVSRSFSLPQTPSPVVGCTSLRSGSWSGVPTAPSHWSLLFGNGCEEEHKASSLLTGGTLATDDDDWDACIRVLRTKYQETSSLSPPPGAMPGISYLVDDEVEGPRNHPTS